MRWIPELFSASYLFDLRRQRREEAINAVSYFDGILSGQVEPLIDSFRAEPELHHPVRGRVKCSDAFVRFITTTSDTLRAAKATVQDVGLIVTPGRT